MNDCYSKIVKKEFSSINLDQYYNDDYSIIFYAAAKISSVLTAFTMQKVDLTSTNIRVIIIVACW